MLSVVGGLEEVVEVLKLKKPEFKSIDEVIKSNEVQLRKRGSRK